MGKRGPPPTPTAILELRGSWRAKVRPGEPAVLPANTEPPAELGKAERKIWRRVIPKLEQMRVLSGADLEMLTRYCELKAIFDAAKVIVQAKGPCYTERDENGNVTVKILPQFEVIVRLHAALVGVEKQFGMSASARAGLNVPPIQRDTGGEDGGDKFIGAGL